jgi:hypothetical protein
MKPLLDFLSGRAITLAASAARGVTAGTNGTTQSLPGHFRRWVILCDITASATDAGDTLNCYVDVSLDGSKWLNAVHFTQQAGDGSARSEYAILDASAPGAVVINVTSDAASGVTRPSAWGLFMRARWVIVEAGGNANASHTFSITAVGQP